MSIFETPILLFGLSIGVIAAEAAWRAVGPFVGTGGHAPPMRTLLAVCSIFGSAALLAGLGNSSQETTPPSYWVNAIGACVVGQVWIAFKTFALLTTGRPSKVMRLSALVAHFLAGGALLALMLAILVSDVATLQLRVLGFSFGGLASAVWASRLRRDCATASTDK